MLVRITASLYLNPSDVEALSLVQNYDSYSICIVIMGSAPFSYQVDTREEAQRIFDEIIEKVQAAQSEEFDGLL